MDFESFLKKYQKEEVIEVHNEVPENPLVSICVQTFNHEKYIAECLDSILCQDVDFEYEILIGEDQSTDRTREICLEYAEKYPSRIRLLLHCRENNMRINGIPTGRFNFFYTVNVARGKYMALCEGDDYWTDDQKLKKQVSFLEDNPDYSLTGHNAQIVDENGKLVNSSKLLIESQRSCTKYELQRGFWVLTLAACFRNHGFLFPDGFDKVSGGDTFLFAYLGQFGHYKYFSDIKPAIYRVHSGGVSSTLDNDEVLRVTKLKMDFLHKFFVSQNKKKIALSYSSERISKIKDQRALLKTESSSFTKFMIKLKLMVFRLQEISLSEIWLKLLMVLKIYRIG